MTTKVNPTKLKPAGNGAVAGRRVPRRATKRDRLIRRLKGAAGREVATLSREFGWQPHTTRAALSRLRKAGYAIERLPPRKNGRSRYRIAVEPPEQTP
jgi:hypothetical protein